MSNAIEIYEFHYNGTFTPLDASPVDLGISSDELRIFAGEELVDLPFHIDSYVRIYPHRQMNFYKDLKAPEFPFFYIARNAVELDVVIFFRTKLAMSEYMLKIGVPAFKDEDDD